MEVVDMPKKEDSIKEDFMLSNYSEQQRLDDVAARYWALSKTPEKHMEIMSELCRLKLSGLSVTPYLLMLSEKYPDAPDILNELVSAYFREGNYIQALKFQIELGEKYPAIDGTQKHQKLIEIIAQISVASDRNERIKYQTELYYWFEDVINELDELIDAEK